jgi:hypothetical protein
LAARQLLYQRECLAWMKEKMAENEAPLERLLVEGGSSSTPTEAGRMSSSGGSSKS